MVTCILVLWHLQVWFVYVVGRFDSSADRFCAPVWELSALKLRPVEHVSWMLNTPDFEYVPVVIIPVCWCDLDRNKYSHSRLFSVKILSAESVHDSPAVRISCPLIGQNSFVPGAHPLPSYVTPFNINIRQFCQWSVSDAQRSGDAAWAP